MKAKNFVNKVICGDCLEVMSTMPENSIDTIITDPPYGLKFMGKEWDHGVPGEPFWTAALRVAKPGAMLLAFGGTRTHHRLMVAIEDAGWKIQDCMMWLYGSGFPKSRNFSKDIDKMYGAKRKVLAIQKRYNEPSGIVNAGRGKQARTLIERKITAPATDAAKQWDGYGTALKPAYEPIIVAMKPLDGTYANNAQKHGVAGFNIDVGRIEMGDELRGGQHSGNGGIWSGRNITPREYIQPQGRWPANVILDKEAGVLLDEQGGKRPGCKSPSKARPTSKFRPSQQSGMPQGPIYPDTGGASRFFYCAKASKSERNAGLPEGRKNTHPTVKPIKLMEYLCKLTATPTGGIVLDPFAGSGSTLLAAKRLGRKYIGIEMDSDYCKIIRNRLRQVTND